MKERQDNKKVEEGVGEEAVVEKLEKEEDVEEKAVEPVKKAVEVDDKLERKEAEEEPEQNEEEEPKAIDSSVDDRYPKFDKLTHNLQWIQEIRIFTAYACSEE